MGEEDFRFLEAATAAGRMEELGRFLDYWFGKRWPEYEEPEERLGRLPLPGPLRRFYAMAGKRPSAGPYTQELFYTGSGGHHLRELDDVGMTEDGKLDFFMEYQGDWSGLTLPGAEDPPVWLRGVFEGGEGEETILACDSLSKFLVTHCLMAILRASKNAPRVLDARTVPPVVHLPDGLRPPSSSATPPACPGRPPASPTPANSSSSPTPAASSPTATNPTTASPPSAPAPSPSCSPPSSAPPTADPQPP